MIVTRNRFAALKERLKPTFWDAADPAEVGGGGEGFNYRWIWKLVVLLVTTVSVVPLLMITYMDYNLNRKAMRKDFVYPINSLLSKTKLSMASFLRQRQAVMEFVIAKHSFEELSDANFLHELHKHMKTTFGGFVDLGLIDGSGRQLAYVGPFDLQGKDYSEQDWFLEVMDRRNVISDVFLGFRDVPHFVIAVKRLCSNGTIMILRATIDTEQFTNLVQSLNRSASTDAFLINNHGVLQTPSLYHGPVLKEIPYTIPLYSEEPVILEVEDARQRPAYLGYVYVANSPFIFMVVKQQQEEMHNWWRLRLEMLGFLLVSITCIVGVVLASATVLVRRIYDADRKCSIALHTVEHTNKMASIGRLAAGVAHEINNPLAVINEKAGLIKDLFSFSDKYGQDKKMLGLVDSILGSVERCSAITHRLLGFARHVDVQWERVDVVHTIRDVLGFLDKEAQYRNITVRLDALEEIPEIVTDKGQLQQVLLNIVNNAFAAVQDGGMINIALSVPESSGVQIAIMDNGCGISPENMKRIFEPFYSTKSKQGTGLGLSITYGLVKKLGGLIQVDSTVGQGTTFTVTLPLNQEQKEGGNANPACG